MNKVLILFKKDFTERFLSIFKRNKKDILGYISTILLILILYGTFIYVYYKFTKMYITKTFDDPSNEIRRLFEILTITYGGIIVINVLLGVKKIYTTTMSTKDMEVLMVHPISSKSIFLYKLIKIYLSQIASTAIIIIPVSIVVANISSYASGVAFYSSIVLHLFLIPMVSCGIAAVLSIGYNYVMDFIEKKFILHLVIYVIILGIGFYLYSIFLNVLTALLQSGDMTYFFELRRIAVIEKICDRAYPINLFAKMMINQNYFLSLMIIIGLSFLCVVLSVFIVGVVYKKLLQIKLEGINKREKTPKVRYKKQNIITSLIIKEFKVVLRTPSYAFQYLATTVTLPFMIYVCVNIMKEMMIKIPGIALVNCDYELAIFVITMFVVITNTFCTTNISRDGKMLYILKTLPVSGKQIVLSKVLFCLIVSEIGLIASDVILLATGFITWYQALVIFIIASLLSASEIMFATRKDLNNPKTTSSDDAEENVGTSVVIFLGLIISIILGGGSLTLSVVVSTLKSSALAMWLSIGFLTISVVVIFVLSYLYLIKSLNKRYHEFEG